MHVCVCMTIYRQCTAATFHCPAVWSCLLCGRAGTACIRSGRSGPQCTTGTHRSEGTGRDRRRGRAASKRNRHCFDQRRREGASTHLPSAGSHSRCAVGERCGQGGKQANHGKQTWERRRTGVRVKMKATTVGGNSFYREVEMNKQNKRWRGAWLARKSQVRDGRKSRFGKNGIASMA